MESQAISDEYEYSNPINHYEESSTSKSVSTPNKYGKDNVDQSAVSNYHVKPPEQAVYENVAVGVNAVSSKH